MQAGGKNSFDTALPDALVEGRFARDRLARPTHVPTPTAA
jgi:hypothetical protein